jgi:putative transcriptional regulator
MTPNQITGKLIREARKRAGLRQHQLAAAVGVSRPSIVQYERGGRPVSVDVLAKIANALGVRPAALMPTHGEIKSYGE